jgi:hypothetical protein
LSSNLKCGYIKYTSNFLEENTCMCPARGVEPQKPCHTWVHHPPLAHSTLTVVLTYIYYRCTGPASQWPKTAATGSTISQRSFFKGGRLIHQTLSPSLSPMHPNSSMDSERVEFFVPRGESMPCSSRGSLYWHKQPDHRSTSPKKVMYLLHHKITKISSIPLSLSSQPRSTPAKFWFYTPSDPYYLSQIWMYLALKCV